MKCAGYVVLFTAMQVVASVMASLVITLALLLSGMDLNAIDLETAGYSVYYEIMILSELLFIAAVFLLKRRNAAREASLNPTAPSALFSGAFVGFAAYAAVIIFLSVVMSLLPAIQQSQDGYMEAQNAIAAAKPAFWAEIVSICLLAPLTEEILCRGLLLNALRERFDPKKAIFISALIFALIHGNLYQIVFTLPLGLLLGWLAFRFGSVWPAVLTHVAFNFSNYPARICMELGFDLESKLTNVVHSSWLSFCFISVPIALFFLRRAMKKVPEPQAEKQGAPFDPFAQDPFAPPSYGRGVPPFTPDPSQFNDFQGGSMAAPEYLIVGLGNPGEKYAQNRHNVGFMALDYIALRERVTIQNLRFKALTGECTLSGKKVLLLKPQTFMNLSGEAVREAAAFYKIPPEKILVIYDDINFVPGVFRIRNSGSAGGHNGIKSIISCLGTDAFPRVKIGVGNPPPQWELMNWVLGNPSPEDQKCIISSLEDVYDSTKLFAAGDLDRASALYNGKQHG